MYVKMEYQTYLKPQVIQSEVQYRTCRSKVTIALGDLINSPPEYNSNTTRAIFTHLDLKTTLAFSQISKNVHKKSEKLFENKYRQFALRYVQIGSRYEDYVKKSGWKDYIISTLKIVGLVATVIAGAKAGLHASAIPKDAPTKTESYTDSEGKTYSKTYIDHPEAHKMRTWAIVSGSLGAATAVGIFSHGIYAVLQNIDLDLFFSADVKEVLDEETTSLGLRLFSPNFHYWKLQEMKKKLTTNPSNWHRHIELKNNLCPLSNDFMLFPVRDSCSKQGHTLDYRSLRAYQLDPKTKNPLECPIASVKPNTGFARIRFDKAKFDWIHARIKDLASIPP